MESITLLGWFKVQFVITLLVNFFGENLKSKSEDFIMLWVRQNLMTYTLAFQRFKGKII